MSKNRRAMRLPFARLYSDFWDHPKTLDAGPLASALFLKAVSHANNFKTDGLVSAQTIASWGEFKGSLKLADKLVDVGYFMKKNNDYQIHDWADHQWTRAEIEDYREKKSRAGAVSAAKRWGLTDEVTPVKASVEHMNKQTSNYEHEHDHEHIASHLETVDVSGENASQNNKHERTITFPVAVGEP